MSAQCAHRRRLGSWRALAFVPALALVAPPALAAGERRENIHLVYHAPRECPTRAELETRLASASPRLTIANDEVATRRFVVDIEDSARRGRLAIESERTTGIREVEGDDCVEVFDQLAFASALALALAPDAPSPPAPQPPSPPRSLPRTTTRLHDTATSETPLRSNAWDHHEIAFGLSSGVFDYKSNVGITASADLLYRAGPLVLGGVFDACGGTQRYWGGGAAVGITAPLPSWLRSDLLGVVGAHEYLPFNRDSLDPRFSTSGVIGFAGARLNASFELAHLAVGLSATAESDLARMPSTSVVNSRFVWGPFVGGTFGL